jgi:hypothetical protein
LLEQVARTFEVIGESAIRLRFEALTARQI